jgi:hypothetical protein
MVFFLPDVFFLSAIDFGENGFAAAKYHDRDTKACQERTAYVVGYFGSENLKPQMIF